MIFLKKDNYHKTRGNIFKLMIPKSKTKSRQNFFANSVTKYWNLLKSSDINTRTNLNFKKKIEFFYRRERHRLLDIDIRTAHWILGVDQRRPTKSITAMKKSTKLSLFRL